MADPRVWYNGGMHTQVAVLPLALLAACLDSSPGDTSSEARSGDTAPDSASIDNRTDGAPGPPSDEPTEAGAGEPHAVGAPCLPEQVPEGGFDEREAYIEGSSLDCETRVCLVFRLRGDPRESCEPAGASGCDPDLDPQCAPPVLCADSSEVADRVYCSCRCDSGDTGFSECECPSGFSCVDVLEVGGPQVRGGYCVRDGTFTE